MADQFKEVFVSYATDSTYEYQIQQWLMLKNLDQILEPIKSVILDVVDLTESSRMN